ncbi:hypothetical protein GCM10011316_35270 [Roseibium aquae]|uniref:Uncharacterized protein n=1 Tax=Roseibium aquae TaxID=1323746 RepID=A0A916TMC4_9HYPH|nr:hypothetical protein [Roseibium aquae]GGB60176.1 hypothetical protein GCM10011316_35270 [Roseibium aquae]
MRRRLIYGLVFCYVAVLAAWQLIAADRADASFAARTFVLFFPILGLFFGARIILLKAGGEPLLKSLVTISSAIGMAGIASAMLTGGIWGAAWLLS